MARGMRDIKTALVVVAIAIGSGTVATAQKAPPQPKAPPPSAQKAPPGQRAMPNRQAITQEIEHTFGFVPQFIKDMPDAALPTFWESIRSFEMADTALDMKTKHLVALGVAATIPCSYCVYFHTEGARAAGASDEQIKEAVGAAAMTRMGSTFVNGLHSDEAQFRKDVDRMMKAPRQQARK